MISAALIWLSLALAHAGEGLDWYVGLDVAQVSLEAPQGGLPRENLEPLLRLRQGDPLDLALVRQDIALLMRAGAFAGVEAHAEPWFNIGPDGEPQDAVRLTYVVVPPPRVQVLDVEGVRGEARRVVEAAAHIQRGEAFFVDEQAEALRARVLEALGREGWPQAQVELEAQGGSSLRLRVLVQPGPERRFHEVTVASNVLAGQVQGAAPGAWRRWEISRRIHGALRRNGVRGRTRLHSGRRVALTGLERAREQIRDAFVDQGWFEARVNYAFTRDASGEHLAVLCDEGPRLTFQRVSGLPRSNELHDVLGLYPGDRLDALSTEDARLRLLQWLDHRGYLDATVEVSIEPQEGGYHMNIVAHRGPRYTLDKVRFEGAESFSDSFLFGAVREAAPDTLGERVASMGGLQQSVTALQELYRGEGFLDARVSLDSVEREGISLRRSLRGWGGMARPVITVQEGARVSLGALTTDGGFGLGAELLADARERLVGEPVSANALDQLARQLTDRYRARGYLGADVQVRMDSGSEPHTRVARLLIHPGNQIRLRSIIVRGNQRTLRSVVAREVALTVGEPVTPEGLAETRRRLYATDLFRVVSPELVGDDDRSRDLLLSLEEKPNILLEAGGGVATDEGLKAKGKVVHRNLGGRGQRIEALGQVGFGWLGDGWRFDTREPLWRASLRYEAPQLPTRGQRLVVEGLLREVLQQPTFRLERSGGRVGIRTGRPEKMQLWLDYGVQVRRLADVDPGAIVVGDPWLDALGLADDLSGEIQTPSALRVQAGPSVLLLRDKRNDRFNPTRGSMTRALFEVSDSLFSSPMFLRAHLRSERLLSLGPVTLDLVARGGVGWAQGTGTTLPVEDRFYLGGSANLRGFNLDSVGPANLSSRPDVDYPRAIGPLVEATSIRDEPSHWVNTGGDSLAAGTVELRVPMPVLGLHSWTSTSLVLFCDAGRVGFLDPAVTTTSSLLGQDPPVRVGLGGGVRMETPIGPVSVDLGLNPWPIAARDEPRIVPHLSLGAL